MIPMETMSVPGAKLVHDDEENKHRIYQFDQPLQPGASGTLTFRTVFEKRGLAALPSDRQASTSSTRSRRANGAYLTSLGFAPVARHEPLGLPAGEQPAAQARPRA